MKKMFMNLYNLYKNFEKKILIYFADDLNPTIQFSFFLNDYFLVFLPLSTSKCYEIFCFDMILVVQKTYCAHFFLNV